jgi:PIN domain nuclease of toxin-antitoxin system
MNGFLLDTHVWIWSQEAPERLSAEARHALEDPGHAVYVATISTLELARLVHLGTIELEGSLTDWVDESIQALSAVTLELSHPVAIEAYSLPGEFHPDPADRILVATARHHDLVLVTADRRILAYPHANTLPACG